MVCVYLSGLDPFELATTTFKSKSSLVNCMELLGTQVLIKYVTDTHILKLFRGTFALSVQRWLNVKV